MPTSRLVSERRGIIAWWKIADGGVARLAVLIAILARRYTEPTVRGAASNIGRPIPTLGVQATITLSEGAQSAVGRRMLVPCLTAYWRTRILLSSTKTSILVRKKQSSASAGLQTMGSFSLKEVLRTIGTSVSWRNASISA